MNNTYQLFVHSTTIIDVNGKLSIWIYACYLIILNSTEKDRFRPKAHTYITVHSIVFMTPEHT